MNKYFRVGENADPKRDIVLIIKLIRDQYRQLKIPGH